MLEPDTSLVVVTPVPDGVKFTLPGPSVTFVYEAITLAPSDPVDDDVVERDAVRCAAS